MCVLAEVRNALRSGDLWVEGSRQYKDLDGYLIPAPTFTTLAASATLPLQLPTDVDHYLTGEIAELERQLALVDEQGGANQLPGVSIDGGRLRIEAADTIVPLGIPLLFAHGSSSRGSSRLSNKQPVSRSPTGASTIVVFRSRLHWNVQSPVH